VIHIKTVLAAEGITLFPSACPNLLSCTNHFTVDWKFVGDVWTWLVFHEHARPITLLLALGGLAIGVVAAGAAYPKTRDTLLAAQRLRQRAEEDPWRKRHRRPLRLPTVYGRFWATRSQIKDMFSARLPRRLAGRLLFLGRWGHQLIATYPGWGGKAELDHLLLVAPTGSGKGTLIKANLAAWQGSAIVAELKGEFYRDLGGYLSRRGQRCFVFSTEGVGHRYDPFLEFDDELGLQTAANLLIQPEKDGRNQIFGQRAALALHAGLLAARRLGRATLPYLAEISAGGMRAYLETLTALGAPAITRKVNAFLSEPPDTKDWDDVQQDRFLQSCWGNLTTRLEPLCAAPILAATSGSDFKATDLRKRTVLFLHFPKDTLEATLPLFQLVNESLLRGLTKGEQARPEHRARPILWICDEAHLLVPSKLAEHLNSLRDWGVVAWIVLQSRAQLRTHYGHDGAEAIEAGCTTQVYYRPADPETSKYISARVGAMPYPQESTNQREADSKGSVSVSLTTRPLIRPEAVMELRDDQILVFPRGRPPVAAHRLWPTDLGYGKTAFEMRRIGKEVRLTPRYAAPALPRLQEPCVDMQSRPLEKTPPSTSVKSEGGGKATTARAEEATPSGAVNRITAARAKQDDKRRKR